MPLLKRRTKDDPEIPSAALADIAFLLLIFFLVTTTIDADKGIYMQLPPKLNEEEPPEINQRNLLNILVSDEGSVLIDNELTDLSQIRPLIIRHVTNNGRDPNLAVSPDKAVVSFKTRRGLAYGTYIDVLDEIKSAYIDIRNQAAQQQFGSDYGTYRSRLGEDDEDVIAEQYPVKISLAEPDPG